MGIAFCFSTCDCLVCKASAVVQGDADNLEHIAGSVYLRKVPSGAAITEPLVVQGPVVQCRLAIPVASVSCRHPPKWLCFLAVA